PTVLRLFRVLAFIALTFVLLVQVPVPNPRSAISGLPSALRTVTFRTDAAVGEIQAAGAELLESYGAFAVARGGEGCLALLREQGRYADPLEGSSTLQLLGGTVDLAALAPRPVAGWPINPRGSRLGLNLLQDPASSVPSEAETSAGSAHGSRRV